MTPSTPRRKAVWGPKLTLLALALVVLAWPLTASAAPKKPTHVIKGHHKVKQTPKVHRTQGISQHRVQPSTVKPGLPSSRVDHGRLDATLQKKKATAGTSKDTVDFIATLSPGQTVPRAYSKYVRRCFPVIKACELDGVPVKLLPTIEQDSRFLRASANHHTRKTDVLSNTAVQADALAAQFGATGTGYTGAGVGVAFIDSGFTSSPMADLTDDRVTFVDFVDPTNTSRIDLDGHGTHVSGIVGGTGTIDAKETGIAPGTSIVSLRVLDQQGNGSIGDIIAALDWVSNNYIQYNIRVVSMSVGAGVYESYWTDPLTLAAKALVDKGIVVVAAAGNVGKNASGQLQWGGITSPGVAPWVLTTCAFSTMGTMDTSDDVMADFSSSGPAYIDFTAKPDICAPGVGIVSLAAPEGRLGQEGALATPSWLVDAGNSSSAFAPYLVLTGTSQATPFVTGTVALMLQANPNLTPNLIKAILQYTASSKPGVSRLRQGAGFMNTLGAVTLAKFYATAQPGAELPIDPSWSQAIDWGNHRVSGGILDPTANAWTPGIEWGWAYTQGVAGDNIAWGTDCGGDCDNIVWGTDDDGDNIVWGTDDNDNIVWGTDDGDNIVWGTDDGDNIVWGTSDDGDNIVWGTDDDDNIVWGTDCGGGDCDNIVWGTDDSDNIVWGTDDDNDNIVWGTDDSDNIVWGTDDDGDNIVWGTSDTSDNVVWQRYR